MKKVLSTQSTADPDIKLSHEQWQFLRKYRAINMPKTGGIAHEDTKINLLNQAKDILKNSK